MGKESICPRQRHLQWKRAGRKARAVGVLGLRRPPVPLGIRTPEERPGVMKMDRAIPFIDGLVANPFNSSTILLNS